MTAPKNAHLKQADRPVFARGGGARTRHMVTPDCGTKALLAGFTEIPPGTAIPLHFHNVEESVLVVSGQAIVEVDGDRFTAEVGDVLWQHANVPHRFINASEDDTLVIYWTYASVDANRTLVETGDTGPILGEHPGGSGA